MRYNPCTEFCLGSDEFEEVLAAGAGVGTVEDGFALSLPHIFLILLTVFSFMTNFDEKFQ